MRIGIDVDYKEFNEIHDLLQEMDLTSVEAQNMIVKYGTALLEEWRKDGMKPSYHCNTCKSDFTTVGEMKSCPKCFTTELKYIGPPRIGHEIMPKKITRLPEAGRSAMTSGSNQNQTHPMFKLCPEDHFSSYEYKGERKGYHLYFCGECNMIKGRRRKILEAVQ
jgi:hypothetical protein